METVLIIATIAFLIFVCLVLAKSISTDKTNASESNPASTKSNKPTPQEIKNDIETLRQSKQKLDMVRASLDDIQIKVNIALRMQKTNNLYTLLSIYNDILEQYGWIEQDRFVDIGAEEDYLSYLNRTTNENILRIAINLYRMAFEKCWEVKTQKGKQNRLASCFSDIERCKTELKEHPNKQYVSTALDDLYSQVEENISNILQGEPLKTFHCKKIQEYEPQDTRGSLQVYRAP